MNARRLLVLCAVLSILGCENSVAPNEEHILLRGEAVKPPPPPFWSQSVADTSCKHCGTPPLASPFE